MMKFQVNDMTCGHCAGTIEKAVQGADPAAKVTVDLANKEVRIDSGLAPDIFSKAMEEAGYDGRLQG